MLLAAGNSGLSRTDLEGAFGEVILGVGGGPTREARVESFSANYRESTSIGVAEGIEIGVL
jgi:hypothetical protein